MEGRKFIKKKVIKEKEVKKQEPIEGSLDLKESLEMLKGFEFIMDCLYEAVEDGKINWKDIDTGLKLLKNLSIITEAAKGGKLIKDELKDLDENEIVLFARRLYPVLKKYKKLILKLKAL